MHPRAMTDLATVGLASPTSQVAWEREQYDQEMAVFRSAGPPIIPDGRASTRDMNKSGVIPLDLRVLALPDTVDTVTPGGIILPPSKVDAQEAAQCKATIIAIGENAWEEAQSRSPHFTKPQAGDRVLMAKYGGITIEGKDGKEYRLLNDADITARLEE